MNEKEVAEIRRRFRLEKSNITHVRVCYVNENREIISQFNQSLAMTEQEETEQILACLKRVLSGTLGKNLMDVTFTTQQVVDSEEHRLLMALKNSALNDEEAVQAFYQKVIQSLTIDGHYMILLAFDTYDVPYRTKDGETQEEAASEVYSYLVCSVCPVKMTKPALSYFARDNLLHNRSVDWILSPPEVGFLFPAFDDRAANLYNALYYSRNLAENHEELAEAVFHCDLPMPAAEQKKCFEALLTTALGEDCNLDVVQTVHDQLCERIELHKEAKVVEPLLIAKADVKETLASCGVSEEHLAKWSVDYDETFGFEADLHPKNIIDTKRFEVKTPDVSIKVDPTRSDLIETRTIGGVKYIMICADENVEVNGVSIHIDEEKEAAKI